jgi:hypothetical protein
MRLLWQTGERRAQGTGDETRSRLKVVYVECGIRHGAVPLQPVRKQPWLKTLSQGASFVLIQEGPSFTSRQYPEADREGRDGLGGG